jgi:hypothetical protein
VAAWVGYRGNRPLDIHRQDITSVEGQPNPEGPPGPVFTRDAEGDRGSLSRPLSAIGQVHPDPFPHTVWQGFNCQIGGDLIVTLLDGTQVAYSPCRRPSSIDELWTHVLDVFTNGECRPRCGSRWWTSALPTVSWRTRPVCAMLAGACGPARIVGALSAC